jgi:quercetin dioxygenase-like cupin family protein
MSFSGVRGLDDQTTPAVLNIFGDLVSIKVAGTETGDQYTVISGQTPPLGGPPLHVHLSDSETFYVVEGTFLFELDGVIHHANTGDVVHIQPGVKHLYQNIGTEPGKLLLVVAPAGLDEFFIELDALLRVHAEPPMPEIAGLHARFKMELLGPPMIAR